MFTPEFLFRLRSTVTVKRRNYTRIHRIWKETETEFCREFEDLRGCPLKQ